jgi:hypothetical protein
MYIGVIDGGVINIIGLYNGGEGSGVLKRRKLLSAL